MENKILNNVRTGSSPSDLRITDIRFASIEGAPMSCSLIKIMTNQGIEGYGEIRDWAPPLYAQMLKKYLVGENPCQIDKLFRRIKQFGGQSRQGGGVSGVELALCDLAGKAWGVPVYQLIGGKTRDKVRIYVDTDPGEGRDTGKGMGQALKERMDNGFTFLKMDLGIHQIEHVKGALCAPLGYFEEYAKVQNDWIEVLHANDASRNAELLRKKNKAFYLDNVRHPFTGIHVTEMGLDLLEEYVTAVRDEIGYEVPLAVDHFGHICVEDCIKVARRLDKYNLAWYEDMIPWQYTDQYVRLKNSCTTPVCTGEDIYLRENFKPLLEAGGVSVIHPDLLTSGGILETKKIAEMAEDNGIAFAMHMAESPVAAMAAAHLCCTVENFLAMEYHSEDIPWWNDIVNYSAKPIVNKGFITVPDAPGFGIDSLNDEVIQEHLNPKFPGLWLSTEEWDFWYSEDRLWS